MKNHEMIDGKLLQTNKKYSQLKQKQKDKIAVWMYEETRKYYEKTGKYPMELYDDEVVMRSVSGSRMRTSGSPMEKWSNITMV